MRPVCTQCGRVHFIDPKVAVALVVSDDRGRLLLVQRANDPQRGKWSFPAGFMDAGEDPARAAEREGLEETGLAYEVTGLLDVYAKGHDAEGADLLLAYLARPAPSAQGAPLVPGDDAAQAGYFPPDELPELAFVSTEKIVARWRALNGVAPAS
jgi:ADP-ribose pyrophosphatase YjhB (NUDIX family)